MKHKRIDMEIDHIFNVFRDIIDFFVNVNVKKISPEWISSIVYKKGFFVQEWLMYPEWNSMISSN